ncbi:beta-defensin-like 1 [Ictalurus furcatus]|uniref:beta-defensin-like 1 n=1 Tax=Ictalurus furcatus TaxID=66913 RepID=UPI0023501F83|nr:beta-defensin-like 1 [Ictalurus furcatus]
MLDNLEYKSLFIILVSSSFWKKKNILSLKIVQHSNRTKERQHQGMIMIYQRMTVLCFLIMLAIAGECKAMVAFPWGCTNYSGVCRPVCLLTELPFGPFGCSKGFV